MLREVENVADFVTCASAIRTRLSPIPGLILDSLGRRIDGANKSGELFNLRAQFRRLHVKLRRL